MTGPAYDYIVGVGGIGKGVLFLLDGDATLGRCETRLAELSASRDYCKQHIILHYAAAFLRGAVPVHAVGRVGDDANGREVVDEMRRAGINVSRVVAERGCPTMYAVCYQYPDGDGGNITTGNSACGNVGAEDVDAFYREARPEGRGIVVAAPEVPLAARLRLLRRGREGGCFNIAAILSAEAEEFLREDGFALADLLAINEDEAETLARLAPGGSGGDAADALIRFAQSRNPDIRLIHTRGPAGSIASHRGARRVYSALPATVRNTAGAGDCYIGLAAAALALGLPFMAEEFDKNVIADAADLGNVASSLKVQNADTIDFSMDISTLTDFARQNGLSLSDRVARAFAGTTAINAKRGT